MHGSITAVRGKKVKRDIRNCKELCVCVCLPLLFFLSKSHGYDTGQTTQDAGHAVQVVDSAGVLDAQAGCQDGLHINNDIGR